MPRQYIEIEEETHWLLRYITLLCRAVGIITGMVMWSATIEILSTSKSIPFIGWYCLGMTIAFTFIESIWLLDKFRCCDNDHGCCCTTWRIFVWIDAWKKTFIYVVIAIPMFLEEYRILYSLIPGCFLVICGAFYFLKSFKHCHCGRRQKLKARHGEIESPEVASTHYQPPPPPAGSPDTAALAP